MGGFVGLPTTDEEEKTQINTRLNKYYLTRYDPLLERRHTMGSAGLEKKNDPFKDSMAFKKDWLCPKHKPSTTIKASAIDSLTWNPQTRNRYWVRTPKPPER
jgi:hypothetical protein